MAVTIDLLKSSLLSGGVGVALGCYPYIPYQVATFLWLTAVRENIKYMKWGSGHQAFGLPGDQKYMFLSLKLTASLLLEKNRPIPKRIQNRKRLVFQPSIFRCVFVLVSRKGRKLDISEFPLCGGLTAFFSVSILQFHSLPMLAIICFDLLCCYIV